MIIWSFVRHWASSQKSRIERSDFAQEASTKLFRFQSLRVELIPGHCSGFDAGLYPPIPVQAGHDSAAAPAGEPAQESGVVAFGFGLPLVVSACTLPSASAMTRLWPSEPICTVVRSG